MQIRHRLAGLMIGIGGGAALAFAAAPESSDPPSSSHGAAPHGSPSHGATHHGATPATGRWAAPAEYHPEDRHAAGHGAGGNAPEVASGCAYFENAGFGGRRGDLRDGGAVEWLGRRWDNRISAIACHAGCRLLAYPDINFGGVRRVFTGGVGDVGPAWNDRISAVRVVCEGAGAH